MFGLSTFRLYAYGAIVVLAGLAYWRYSYVVHALASARAQTAEANHERDQVRADYAAYKQAAATDAALNRKTREVLQTRLTQIERTRAAVSVRCYAASVPSATASSGAATGADAAPIDGGATALIRDVGSALEDARIEALKNNNNYMGLQEWELARR